MLNNIVIYKMSLKFHKKRDWKHAYINGSSLYKQRSRHLWLLEKESGLRRDHISFDFQHFKEHPAFIYSKCVTIGPF